MALNSSHLKEACSSEKPVDDCSVLTCEFTQNLDEGLALQETLDVDSSAWLDVNDRSSWTKATTSTRVQDPGHVLNTFNSI